MCSDVQVLSMFILRICASLPQPPTCWAGFHSHVMICNRIFSCVLGAYYMSHLLTVVQRVGCFKMFLIGVETFNGILGGYREWHLKD
ncbi:hypothetical protein BGZ60DRAFT_274955 [Tricladium varicosporioides]|nr:hypothetical protein BGZ60DRAFT_274955 [Hymenoscyphus varicosporioides]